MEREQRGVDLHRDVLAAAERAADPREMDAHAFERQPEARSDLGPVDVQPLRGHVDVDAALAVGDGKARLGAEERLVLDSRLVDALDGDLAGRVRVPVPDDERPDDVRTWIVAIAVPLRRAVGVQLGAVGRPLHVGDRLERLVVDRDLLGRATCLLRMVGGDQRHRLAEVPDEVAREHRLVAELEAVALLAGNVSVGEDGVHAGHRNGLRDVEVADPGVCVRAPERMAEEHSRRREVARVRELPPRLRHAVGAGHDLADPAERDSRRDRGRIHRSPATTA